MPDLTVTAAELQAAIRQLDRIMVRTDDGDASGVILYPEMLAKNLAGLIANREERGFCRECSHGEREHREISSKDGGCEACDCRHYRAPLPAPVPVADPEPLTVHDSELCAMVGIVGAMERLDGWERGRVIRWASERYGDAGKQAGQ